MKKLPLWIKAGLFLLVLGLVTLIFDNDFVRGFAELPIWLILGDEFDFESFAPYLTCLGLLVLFIVGSIVGCVCGFLKSRKA